MAQSLVDLIKLLRERTGAGMMDCRGALLACDSDLDKATDWLREKGLAKASKKADRIAAEGLALTKTCPSCGKTIVIEVNCETDFVSKGEDFRNLVEEVAGILLHNDAKSLEEAKNLTSDLFSNATVKMGEKLDLRRFEIIHPGEGERIKTYIHMGGKIATAVLLKGGDEELANGLAMHIAANNPQYINLEDVPSDVREHEYEVEAGAAKNDPKLANKPENILKNILQGKINKHFGEMTLTLQPYLLDDTKTVGQVLSEKKAAVIKYVRYQVGEGIEKRKDDFASEVMSQVNG